MDQTAFKLNDRDRKIADWNIDWTCIDCGTNTAPTIDMAELERNPDAGFTLDDRCEVYWVRPYVWQRAGNPEGCLCIGCLETRIERRLKRKDFPRPDPQNPDTALNDPTARATPRLLARRR